MLVDTAPKVGTIVYLGVECVYDEPETGEDLDTRAVVVHRYFVCPETGSYEEEPRVVVVPMIGISHAPSNAIMCHTSGRLYDEGDCYPTQKAAIQDWANSERSFFARRLAELDQFAARVEDDQ